MTLLTLAQAVARETQEDSDFTTVEGSIEDYIQRIIDWINEGYDQSWKETYGKNQDAHTSGTWTISSSPYNISSKGIKVIKKLSISDYMPITIISFDEFMQGYSSSNRESRPTIASLFQDKLHLFPSPDESYSVNYYAIASMETLSEDTDVPIIDEDIIKAYAKHKQYTFDKDFASADREFLTFDRLLKQYKRLIKAKRGGLPPIMKPEDAYFRDNSKVYDIYDGA